MFAHPDGWAAALSSTPAHPACTSWPTQLPLWTLTQPPSPTAGFSPYSEFTLSPPPAPHSNCHRIPRLPLVSLPGSYMASKQSFTKQLPIALQIETKLTKNTTARRCLPLAPSSAHKLLPLSPLPSPPWPTFQLPDSPSSTLPPRAFALVSPSA